MPSTTLKRRWTEDGMKGRVPKKQKKPMKRQRFYHSSSDDDSADEGAARDAPQDFQPVSLQSSDEEAPAKPVKPQPKFSAKIATKKASKSAPQKQDVASSEEELDDDAAAADTAPDSEDEEEGEDSEADASDASTGTSLSETSTNNPRKPKKRNDPEAFATSISRILSTKLTSAKRSEPILSRSKAAHDTNKALADHKLTQKAHRTLLAEKRAAQEKGRVKDVLGLDKVDISTAEIVAEEKKLRRTAQRGVIKLFNAVRAAQVKGEEAIKQTKEQGVVGMGKREEKVKEMSKQGFLDMIAGGGKKKEDSVEI